MAVDVRGLEVQRDMLRRRRIKKERLLISAKMVGCFRHLPLIPCKDLGEGSQHPKRSWEDGADRIDEDKDEDQPANNPPGEQPRVAAQQPKRSGKQSISTGGGHGRRELEEEEGDEGRSKSRREEEVGVDDGQGDINDRERQGIRVVGTITPPRRQKCSSASRRMMHSSLHWPLLLLAAMTPFVAGQNCTAGQVCCQIPPCLCGTYIACGDAACTSASVRPKASPLSSPQSPMGFYSFFAGRQNAFWAPTVAAHDGFIICY